MGTKKIAKLITYSLGIIGILVFTVIFAARGKFAELIGLLCAYTFLILVLEKGMKSFVGNTKMRTTPVNKDIRDRRTEIGNMFERAEEYVNIVSGCLRHEVYSDDELIKKLGLAIEKRKVKVEIITEDSIDPATYPLIEKWVDSKYIDLFRLKECRVSRHFIVVDGIEVRLEQPHGDNYEEIKASYWLSYRRLGYHTKKKFEEIKKKAVPVSVNP